MIASHGHCSEGKVSPVYLSWGGMIARCTNPKATGYIYYGGRGIEVCERWFKFENFLKDMGDRPEGMTLDRFPDKNGNYEPGNCRWATMEEQNLNKGNNVLLTHEKETMTIAQWAKRVGISARTLRDRIKVYGWSVDRALLEPAEGKVMVTYDGKTLDFTQWAKLTGIPRGTLRQRILIRGWPVQKALNTPVKEAA